MHELGIAARIRSTLETELAADTDAGVVEVVRLRVGALTGIAPEALQSAWPHAVADSSLLAESVVDIELVDARVVCRQCSTSSPTPVVEAARCAVCGSAELQLAGGDELTVVSVDTRGRAGDQVTD